jgi:FkbM family methyltransferase
VIDADAARLASVTGSRLAVTALSFAARVAPQPLLDWIRSRRALSSLLSRLLPGEPRLLRVAGGPISGMWLELHPATEKAFWAGAWEPEIAAILEREGRGRAWDVGAHLGYFTLVLWKRCDHVVAVEANPVMAARLRRNLDINGAQADVVEAAVTDRSGTVELELASESGMSRVAGQAGVSDAEITGSVEVRATTLDALLAQYGAPDFVKLDIEGAELPALRASPRFLAAARTVLCDLHGDGAMSAVPVMLEQAGFDVAFVTDSCVLARRSGAPS